MDGNLDEHLHVLCCGFGSLSSAYDGAALGCSKESRKGGSAGVRKLLQIVEILQHGSGKGLESVQKYELMLT